MKNEYKSLLMVILAGCLWGCMGLLVRPLNLCGMQSMDIVAIRSWVTLCITLLTFPLLCKMQKKQTKNEIRIKLSDIWIFIGTGIVSIVFFNFCYFTTIVLTDLSIAAIMLYTAPIFVMLISATIFGEKISVKKMVALILAFVGCCIVTGALGGNLKVSGAGLLFGLGSGIGYALYSIFGKLATDRGYSSVTITLYTFLFSSIGVLPFADYGLIFNTMAHDMSMCVYAVVMILVVTFFPYIFYTRGLAGISPGKAAITATIEPVAATAVGFMFFGEKPSWITACGIIMVILAIVLVSENKANEE